MKRRDFIKSSALAGGSLGIASTLSSCVDEISDKQISYYKDQIPKTKILQELENGHLHVKVYSNASMNIFDKANNFEWQTGPVAIQELGQIEEGHVWLRNDRSMCEQYPGRFTGRNDGDSIEFTLLGRQNRAFGKFTCQFSLDQEWFSINTINIEEGIPSLVFPPPIESEELIIPKGAGQLISNKAGGAIFSRSINSFFAHLNMRFISGQKNGHAWIGIYEDGFEDACAMIAAGTAAPGYTRTNGAWSHSYRMKYKFMKGNYVDVAKTYRKDFKEKGLFRSLNDKIKENSELKKYIGGRAFWITLARPSYKKEFIEDYFLSEKQIGSWGDQDVAQGVHIQLTYQGLHIFLDKLMKNGFKNGYIKVAGWIKHGYDASHPDVWPPEGRLGTVQELKSIMELDVPYSLGLHDNYQDIYESTKSFPKGVNHLEDGTLQIGGAWAGGQAYILNSEASVAYAKRNWDKISTLNPSSIFVDTTTAVSLYQSSEEGNEQTKADDLINKSELIKFYKDHGVLFGSEEVADFAIPHIDWYETRHTRIQGETIPLWALVFHDAALLLSYGSGATYPSPSDSSHAPKWLEMMQWGYMLHFSYSKNFDFEGFSKSFFVDNWHKRIALFEMTNHEFLNEEKSVERTEFSNGAAIICNYGMDPATVDGFTIQKHDFRIIG